MGRTGYLGRYPSERSQISCLAPYLLSAYLDTYLLVCFPRLSRFLTVYGLCDTNVISR